MSLLDYLKYEQFGWFKHFGQETAGAEIGVMRGGLYRMLGINITFLHYDPKSKSVFSSVYLYVNKFTFRFSVYNHPKTNSDRK